jgi:glycosyltransferase involved in cell wall biosynthesis
MSNNTDLYYVHLFNDFSGSPRVLRDAIDSQLNSPENTYVFTSKHAGFLDGVNAQRVNCFYARSNNKYLQLCYFLLSQFIVFFKLFYHLSFNKLFRRRKATVVINTMLPFGAGFASKIMSDNIVYYVHETFIKPDSLKFFLRFFIEHCATHVIFVSKYLSIKERFSNPIQNVLYNGLRSDFPSVISFDKYKKFSERIVVFAGSLKIYKGVEQLLDLAAALPDFKIIAALNCEVSDLNDFKVKHDIPENIEFLSRPPDIFELFRISFAVLNLSLPDVCIETFGLSLIEGLALGSPVVAPPVGGPVEFVTSDNGFLIDSRKTVEIAIFLRSIADSFDVWESYSDHAVLTSERFTSAAYKDSIKKYFYKYNLI